MKQKRLVIDEVIKWNRRKMKEARVAGNEQDEDRYADNIKNLVEYKEALKNVGD